MFKFKKAMEGVKKQEGFECECCGPMEGQAGTSGCGCGPVNVPCCGPVNTQRPEESSCNASCSKE